jgi:hypothetical protein
MTENLRDKQDVDVYRFATGLNEYMRAVHACAEEHGWWEEDRNFGEMIALMHSELSEALEAWRDHDIPTEIRYEYPNPGDQPGIVLYTPRFVHRDDNGNPVEELGKPVGVASEFADVIIRILDTCERLQIPITKALLDKHRYNQTRPYRHGGKKA